MSPEWQRRAVAIFLTVLSIAPIREIEPYLAAATGLPGVWITRIVAIAILIWCFKLTDMIPSHEWHLEEHFPRLRAVHLVVAAISIALILISYAAAH